MRDAAGLNPDLSDPEPELFTITLYTHTPHFIQQPANCDIGTVFTLDTNSDAYFQNVLEVLTFHSVPRSLRPEAHSWPLVQAGSMTQPLHSTWAFTAGRVSPAAET